MSRSRRVCRRRPAQRGRAVRVRGPRAGPARRTLGTGICDCGTRVGAGSAGVRSRRASPGSTRVHRRRSAAKGARPRSEPAASPRSPSCRLLAFPLGPRRPRGGGRTTMHRLRSTKTGASIRCRSGMPPAHRRRRNRSRRSNPVMPARRHVASTNNGGPGTRPAHARSGEYSAGSPSHSLRRSRARKRGRPVPWERSVWVAGSTMRHQTILWSFTIGSGPAHA